MATSPLPTLSHFGNPLAKPEQLSHSSSQLAGVPRELEDAIRYRASCLLQATGIFLRLPQTTIAETIIIFCRVWLGPTAPSLLDVDVKDFVAAALFLVTKTGEYPLSPGQVLNALYYTSASRVPVDRMPVYTEAQLELDRLALVRAESQILKVLGFNTHVVLPYALCVNYLQTLDAFEAASGRVVAQRAHAHLNAALFSPQLVYLTQQPHALCVAAIYLAARECSVKLPGEQWWEVFDVDREELGFLVVALTSMAGFVEAQASRVPHGPLPLTARDLKEHLANLP